MAIKESELTEEKISQIFEDGVCSQAEVCVGEVVSVILEMSKIMKDTQSWKNLLLKVGKDKERHLETFMIGFLCSEISTLTATFESRDLEKGLA